MTEAAVQAENLPVPQKPANVVRLEAGARVAPIVPRTIEEVARIAKAVIVAGLAPNSYQGRNNEETISKIMIGVLKGAEVGLAPLTALSNICIINGRPTIWGDGAMALVQASGEVERVETAYEGQEGMQGKEPAPNDFPDTFTAVYRIWRKGQAQPYEGRFSVKDARRAHLWGNPKRAPWIEYPRRMLMMRARAFAIRDGFADALSGLSIREEVEDLPPEAPAKTDTAFLSDDPAPESQAPAAQAEDASQEPVTVELGGEPAFLPIPERDGANDYEAWCETAAEIIRTAITPKWLADWKAANATTIDGLRHTGKNGPAMQKRILDLIEGRRSELLAGA